MELWTTSYIYYVDNTELFLFPVNKARLGCCSFINR